MHDLLAREVLARVLTVQSFWPKSSARFSCRSSHALWLSVFFLCLFLRRPVDPLTPIKTTALVVTVPGHAKLLLPLFLNELQGLFWLLRGRSHTLPWRLRDSPKGSLSLSQNRGLTNPYFWQLSDFCIYRRLKVRWGKKKKKKHLPKGDCILEIYYFTH